MTECSSSYKKKYVRREKRKFLNSLPLESRYILICNFLRMLVLNVNWEAKGVLAWALASGIVYVV